MDDSRGYFKLGLFVLITAAMLVGFVVAPGGQSIQPRGVGAV